MVGHFKFTRNYATIHNIVNPVTWPRYNSKANLHSDAVPIVYREAWSAQTTSGRL